MPRTLDAERSPPIDRLAGTPAAPNSRRTSLPPFIPPITALPPEGTQTDEPTPYIENVGNWTAVETIAGPAPPTYPPTTGTQPHHERALCRIRNEPLLAVHQGDAGRLARGGSRRALRREQAEVAADPASLEGVVQRGIGARLVAARSRLRQQRITEIRPEVAAADPPTSADVLVEAIRHGIAARTDRRLLAHGQRPEGSQQDPLRQSPVI